MKLVALTRKVRAPEQAAARLAAVTEGTLAEARVRLAPEAPAILGRFADDRADAIVAALRDAGESALAIDARVPTDDDRLVARTLAFDDEGGTFVAAGGATMRLAWSDVCAVLRGATSSRTETEHTSRERKLSLGSAVMTGGMKWSTTTERTSKTTEETTVQAIFVCARDGRVAVVRERGFDFTCMGAALQPSRTANMTTLVGWLAARARGAVHDDRLLRLGRRPMPLLGASETVAGTSQQTTRTAATTTTLDVLVAFAHAGTLEGLFP